MKPLRWRVEIVRRSLWIVYREDLARAMIFRTQAAAFRYATAGGAL